MGREETQSKPSGRCIARTAYADVLPLACGKGNPIQVAERNGKSSKAPTATWKRQEQRRIASERHTPDKFA